MTTDTQGDTTQHISSFTGYVAGNPSITASASGTLQTVGINLYAAVGNICLAIYDDDGSGNANNLLGYSASTAAQVGWNDLTMPGVNIVQGTAYHLEWEENNNTTAVYKATTGLAKYKAQAYGSFPNPMGSMTNYANTMWNMRMTYAPAIVYKNLSDSGTDSESMASTSTLPMADSGAGVDVLSEKDFGVLESGLALDAVLRQYTITGTVKDASGNPVPGATVWLFRTSDEAFIQSATADANGVFVLPLSDISTQYFIRAHLDSYQGNRVFGTTDRQLVAS